MALTFFIDGSSDPQRKVGYGAVLVLGAEDSRLPEDVAGEVVTRCFQPTSSSRLELQTLLWALGTFAEKAGRNLVYTDSQTIVELPARLERLEKAGFCSRGGRPLTNAVLYREFRDLIGRLDCVFLKVSGHGKAAGKTREELLFALVDKASRRALRERLASED